MHSCREPYAGPYILFARTYGAPKFETARSVTSSTERSRALFDDMKLTSFHALYSIYDSEIAARDAGNVELARHLYDNREKLMARFLELRRAELVYAKSDKPCERQNAALHSILATMQTSIDGLADLDQAREGSDRLVSVLTNLSEQLR